MGALNFFGSPAAPVGAVISKAAAATTDLVGAVAGTSVRVYGIRLSVAGAVIVTLLDGATVLEVFNFAGNGGAIGLDLRELPYYTTASGAALRITLSTAVQVDGRLEYSQAKA